MITISRAKLALFLVGTSGLMACQPAATAYEYGGPPPSYHTGAYGNPPPEPYVNGYGQSPTYRVILDSQGQPAYRDGRRAQRYGTQPQTGYQPYYQGHDRGYRKGQGYDGGTRAANGYETGNRRGQGQRKSAQEIDAEIQHQRALERQAQERTNAKERARTDKQRQAAYQAEERRRAALRASRRDPGLSEYVPRSVTEIAIIFDGYRHVGETDASLADRVRRSERIAEVEGISIHRVLRDQIPKDFNQK